MITQTMTDDEITKELERDLLEVQIRIMANEKEFRRLIIKSSHFPVSAEPSLFTTVNRNKWIVIFRAMSRKERKKICYNYCTYICTASFSNGIYAFLNTKPLSEESKGIGLAVFPPHFFSRYRSRFNTKYSGIDLIAHYFLKNHSYSCAFQDKEADGTLLPEKKVYGTSQEGIALGMIKSQSATLFKTFITYDMMHEEQIPEFTQKEIFRQKAIAQSISTPLRPELPEKTEEEAVVLSPKEELEWDKLKRKLDRLFKPFKAIDTGRIDSDNLKFVLNGMMQIMLTSFREMMQIESANKDEYQQAIEETEQCFREVLANPLFTYKALSADKYYAFDHLLRSQYGHIRTKLKENTVPMKKDDQSVITNELGPVLHALVSLGIMQKITKEFQVLKHLDTDLQPFNQFYKT